MANPTYRSKRNNSERKFAETFVSNTSCELTNLVHFGAVMGVILAIYSSVDPIRGEPGVPDWGGYVVVAMVVVAFIILWVRREL